MFCGMAINLAACVQSALVIHLLASRTREPGACRVALWPVRCTAFHRIRTLYYDLDYIGQDYTDSATSCAPQNMSLLPLVSVQT